MTLCWLVLLRLVLSLTVTVDKEALENLNTIDFNLIAHLAFKDPGLNAFEAALILATRPNRKPSVLSALTCSKHLDRLFKDIGHAFQVDDEDFAWFMYEMGPFLRDFSCFAIPIMPWNRKIQQNMLDSVRRSFKLSPDCLATYDESLAKKAALYSRLISDKLTEDDEFDFMWERGMWNGTVDVTADFLEEVMVACLDNETYNLGKLLTADNISLINPALLQYYAKKSAGKWHPALLLQQAEFQPDSTLTLLTSKGLAEMDGNYLKQVAWYLIRNTNPSMAAAQLTLLVKLLVDAKVPLKDLELANLDNLPADQQTTLCLAIESQLNYWVGCNPSYFTGLYTIFHAAFINRSKHQVLIQPPVLTFILKEGLKDPIPWRWLEAQNTLDWIPEGCTLVGSLKQAAEQPELPPNFASIILRHPRPETFIPALIAADWLWTDRLQEFMVRDTFVVSHLIAYGYHQIAINSTLRSYLLERHRAKFWLGLIDKWEACGVAVYGVLCEADRNEFRNIAKTCEYRWARIKQDLNPSEPKPAAQSSTGICATIRQWFGL